MLPGALQADVCHAYQILRKGGVKEENIVVFMYDDIAHNILNPRPGTIINHPKGGDVYAGVPKVAFSFNCSFKKKRVQVVLVSVFKFDFFF